MHMVSRGKITAKSITERSTGKKVSIRRQAKQGGTTPMLQTIVNSRRRENHGPPAQLHNESSDEENFGDEL